MATSSNRFDQFLNYCNLCLLMKGVNLKTTSSHFLHASQLFLQLSCLFSVVFFSVYTVYYWILKIDIDRLNPKVVLQLISEFVGSVGAISTSLCFIYYKSQIVVYTKQLFAQLPECDQTRVVKASLILASVDLISYYIYTLVKVISHCIDNKGVTFKEVIFILLDNMSSTYIVTGCCVYTAFLSVLHCYTCHQLTLVNNYLKRQDQHKIKVVNKVLSRVLQSLSEFDNLFSLHPLNWFSNALMFASFNVLILSSTSQVYRIVYLIMFVIENTAAVFVVVMLSNCRSKWKRQCHFILQHLVDKDNGSHNIGPFVSRSIIQLLNSIGSFKMTAFSLFTLDTSIILPFIGTVITFTVLFLELTSEE